MIKLLHTKQHTRKNWLAITVSWIGMVIFFIHTPLSAQLIHDIHKQRYLSDSVYRQRTDDLEAFIYRQTILKHANGNHGGSRAVLTIPVVVHIMHLPGDVTPNDNSSNLTDARIQAGINYLNEAFRNTGAYAGGPFYSDAGIQSVDTEIEFCLAKYDPLGNPATGINRVPTNLSNLNRDDPCPSGGSLQDLCLKGQSFWDSNKYLNIWLVNQICINAGGPCDIDGYAYLAAAHGEPFDGAVFQSSYWGASPEKNAVVTREVGRYLNLFYTHNKKTGATSACENDNCLLDGDNVCDTPPDSGVQVVDCLLGQTANTCSSDADDASAINPFEKDVQDMYENFMDGGNYHCKNTFTPGQKTRMRTALIGIRSSLLSSSGCTQLVTNIGIKRIKNPLPVSCEPNIVPNVVLVNTGNTTIGSIVIGQKIDANSEKQKTWSGLLDPGDSVSVDLIALNASRGMHKLKVTIKSVNGVAGDFDEKDNLLTFPFVQAEMSTVIDQFPYCEDFDEGSMPLAWTKGDFDGIISFDLLREPACSQNGNYAMRYNSSGLWNNGAGPMAATTGTRDAFVSPVIDLTQASHANMTFDVAYKSSLPNKKLRLIVSAIEDCTSGLTSLYDKQHTDLETSSTAADPTIIGWEPGSCAEWRAETIDLNEFRGKRIRLIFDAHLQSSYSQNFYLDNICIDVTPVCVLPDAIPDREGVYTADTSCTDTAGWTHFWKTAAATPVTSQDLLLFSIKDLDVSGASIDPDGVAVVITDQYARGGHDLTATAAYATNDKGWYTMGRYFRVQPNRQPKKPIQVQFYYNSTDWDDLNLAISPLSMTSQEDLVFFTLPPEANPDPVNGHAAISPEHFREYRFRAPEARKKWEATSYTNFFGAVFTVDTLFAGSGGTGGDAAGNGARYPVAIQNFRVNQLSGVIQLEWNTLLERNTSHFDVFRSDEANGAFEKIGEAPANGNSSDVLNYAHFDHSPEEKGNYYYLALQHTDGMTLLSDTVSLTFDPSRVVSVYPNPFTSSLKVAMEASPGEQIKLGIYDGGWQELYMAEWSHAANTTPDFDISFLAPGIYFYVVSYGEQTYRGKLLKAP